MHPEEHQVKQAQYLPEFVYGGIDGSVTTFAVVAGAAGANLPPSIVIILGFANLIADGFSMSVGNYLSVKSENEQYEKEKQREYWEVDHLPEAETEEIRAIYREKGFEGELLEQVVEVITADKDRWVDTMMKEELEMTENNKPPLKSALVTFFAFIIVGLIPLLTYLIAFIRQKPDAPLFELSCVLTSFAFLLIGWLKSSVTETSRWKSILETLILGGIAAVLAYTVGDLLEGWLA